MAKFPVFRFQEYGPGGGAAAPANLERRNPIRRSRALGPNWGIAFAHNTQKRVCRIHVVCSLHPPRCNTSTTLDSLTLQTARRERQPHTAEIGWRGSAVTDEIQWAESPFFEIPILSFEGRVGNR